MKKHFVVAASFVALIGSGAAAGAVQTPLPSGTPAGPRAVVERFLSSFFPISQPTAGPGATSSPGPATPFAGLPAGSAAGYSAGTVFHDLITETNTEMGLSNAGFSTGPLAAGVDELAHALPPLAAGEAKAHGRALENRIGDEDTTPEEAEPADSQAPPSRAPVTKQQDFAVQQLFKASSLASAAGARAVPNGCVIGSNISYGIGSVTDPRVADRNGIRGEAPLLALNADGERAVSTSQSRTFLAPPVNAQSGFGLVAQTRQTVAPITLGPDPENPLVIEVAGEWVLSVYSDGNSQFKATFGPDPNSLQDKDDNWPVLRIVQGKPGRGQQLFTMTLGQVLGKEGKQDAPFLGNTITVGENPRALGDEEGVQNAVETPNLVAAAADVVRIQTNSGDDIRIGHMEAAVTVPPGGVQCPGVGLVKKSSPQSVRAGDRFSWDISVSNPNDCTLRDVKVIDTPAPSPGVRYTVKSTSPGATQTADGTITFDPIDQLPLGGVRTLRIDAVADDTSAPGTIANSATAAGTCSGVNRAGSATSNLTVRPAPLVPAPDNIEPPPVGAGGDRYFAPAPARSAASAAGRSQSVRPEQQPARAEAEASRQGRSDLPSTGGFPGAELVASLSLVGVGIAARRWPRQRGKRP